MNLKYLYTNLKNRWKKYKESKRFEEGEGIEFRTIVGWEFAIILKIDGKRFWVKWEDGHSSGHFWVKSKRCRKYKSIFDD